ncbi:MAG: transporter substrate-binding domain-containing protein [Treponema sp.]|jgi:ABC-type amino acid transport substrate-binding protein|nr:transporter substrate-binding domain-containing protein [Treponema sp.]
MRNEKRKISSHLSFILLFSLFIVIAACEKAPATALNEPSAAQSPFDSFRDIPGITPQEIAAIEGLRQRHESFSYGMTLSTEAFRKVGPDGTYAVGGYAALFCEWLTSLFGIEFQPAIYSWVDLLAALESGELDFSGDLTANDERRKTYIMSDPIAERQYKTIQPAGSPPISQIALTRRPRYAFVIGSANEAAVAKVARPGSYVPVWVRNHAEIIAALESELADAFVGDGVVMASFDAHGGMYADDFFPPVFSQVSMSTANPDLKPIISAVTKALQNGTRPWLNHLYNQGHAAYKKINFMCSSMIAKKTICEILPPCRWRPGISITPWIFTIAMKKNGKALSLTCWPGWKSLPASSLKSPIPQPPSCPICSAWSMTEGRT